MRSKFSQLFEPEQIQIPNVFTEANPGVDIAD